MKNNFNHNKSIQKVAMTPEVTADTAPQVNNSTVQKDLADVVTKLISKYQNLQEQNKKLINELLALKDETNANNKKSKEELDKLETMVLEQDQENDDIYAKIAKVLGE